MSAKGGKTLPDHPPLRKGPAASKRDWKIYTRFGDAGQTMLLGKVQVSKDNPRVNVYGTLDEATSALGMARASTHYDDICKNILSLQGELIGVMSELATPPEVAPSAIPVSLDQVERLECLIDAYEGERIATNQFIRPGGSLPSAALDLARSIVRRAERHLVALNREEAINPCLLKYINRLSDLLYVMARIDEQREIRRMVMDSLKASGEQMVVNHKAVLSLETCGRLIEAGIRRAHEIGVPMVLAVADESGNLIELRRMDNALIVSIALAPNKAFTAATVRMPTAALAGLAQPGAPLYGIDANIPNLTLVGGGLPLVVDGRVVGSVGVSGGSVEQDVDVAQAMVAAFG